MAEDDINTGQASPEAEDWVKTQAAADNQQAELAEGVETAEENNADVSVSALQAELTRIRKELSQAQEELTRAQDQVLRVRADAQNVQRRAQQDVEKAHKFGLEKFARAMLPVIDSLERGLESTDATESSHEAIREGMALTLKLFLDTLSKFSIEQVNPVGEPFNHDLHQAMNQVESTDLEPGSVLDVFQKGYTLNGRLIRPAMVVVTKAPAAV